MTTLGVFIAGRYRLVHRVAAGGMGSVWEAWDELLQRRVAVKQLLPQPGLNKEEAAIARHRVIREARITARLHHPNAVTLYDVVEDAGNPCLIMQYVPSRSLSSLLAEKGILEATYVARIGAELASALAAAHEVGIVHRDVKPSNVLITHDGSAKVTDFGISHAVGDVSLTSTGMVSGTPAFLAPEVARGGMSGFPADVFSLGATLYTALEGSPPFGSDQNPMALLHRVASGRPTPPQRSGLLTPLLVRMLAPEPADRPPMTDVARALTELHTGALLPDPSQAKTVAVPPRTEREWASEGTAAANPIVPPSTVAPPRRPLTSTPPPGRRRPVGALVAAVLAVLVAAAILVGFLALRPGRSGQNVAVPSPSPPGSSIATTSLSARSSARSSANVVVPPPSTSSSSVPLPGPLTSVSKPTRSASTVAQTTPPSTTSAAPILTSIARRAVPPLVSRSTTQPTTKSQSTASTATTEPLTTAESSTESSTTESSTTESSATTRSAESGTEPTATQLAAAVVAYYDALPGNTDAGWARLTPKFQNGIARNREYYQNFWDGVTRVDITDAQGEPPNVVTATLTYHLADGSTSVERTVYRVVRENGVLKIDDSVVPR